MQCARLRALPALSGCPEVRIAIEAVCCRRSGTHSLRVRIFTLAIFNCSTARPALERVSYGPCPGSLGAAECKNR